MSKKEQVQFVRTNEFTDVEEELNAAMANLDTANFRIEELLSGKLEIPTVNADAAEVDEDGQVIEKPKNIATPAKLSDSSDSSDDSDSDSDSDEDDDEEDAEDEEE